LSTSRQPQPHGSTWWIGSFRDLTENKIRRGVFQDIEQIITAICKYIVRQWNAP
jgi:hypothetical protein